MDTHIGFGCPLGSRHWHFTFIRNPFGWALYLGPIYVMRTTP